MCKTLIISVLSIMQLTVLSAQNCRFQPPFIAKLGFDPNRSALSSSETREMGVVLIQLSDAKNTQSTRDKIYRDTSWRMAGVCSAICLDDAGNAFVLPSASVNNLDNPPEKQNTVYKIDGKSGKMSPFVDLPMLKKPHPHNAFGLIGASYDCDSRSLFVSSIAGSDAQHEIGALYAIKSATGTYKLLLDSTDAIGICVGNLQGERRLYYGKARSSEVFSLPLSLDNAVLGPPRFEFSLNDLGPRGDDRAYKLKFSATGLLEVGGIPFFYNLTAITPNTQTFYSLGWSENRWQLIEIR